MRHNLNIFVGKGLLSLADSVQRHCLKYGVQEAADFSLCAYLIKEDDGNIAITNIQRMDVGNSFVSDLQDEYQVVSGDTDIIHSDKFISEIKAYLIKLFSSSITINNPGDYDHMLLTIYVPAFDNELVELTASMATCAKEISEHYDVDVVMLTADVLRAIDNSADVYADKLEERNEMIKSNTLRFAKMRNEGRIFTHVVTVDNKNVNGLSLELGPQSLSRILGEYILLITENYSSVYNHVDSFDQEFPVNIFGLSVLNFDKYYYVHYLLRRAYLRMMDRENIMQENVDINKAGTIANNLVKTDLQQLDGIWNTYVRPLKEKNNDDNSIVVAVKPQLDSLFDGISEHLQSFMSSNDLSLPEKQAALAMIIGEDDSLLQGYSFCEDNLTVDDFDNNLSQFFIRENNSIVDYEASKRKAELAVELLQCTSDEEKEKLKKKEAKAEAEDLKKMMFLPLAEIKDLRKKIRQSTNYIREKTKDIEGLEKQYSNVTQAERRLTREGFRFDGTVYHLQGNIEERSLEETYTAHEVSEDSIDLRNNFTAIRDQGEQGSCSSFALTAIYEYILKKSGVTSPDLSEAFLYYNTRKKDGKTSENAATSLYDTLEAMQVHGICSEEIFPYNPKIYDLEPPQEAYDDGKKRLLLKAQNVKLTVDDIRSAISDGYPVAISMKVYDSFTTGGAFLQRVSKKEKEGENSNHAMVICGYSDADRVFIVRNSWGKNFGDKGYCYMPYYYVSRDAMLNQAYIITETGEEGVKPKGIDKKITVSFDQTNALIKSAILHILVEDEKIQLEDNKQKYADVRRSYDLQMGMLGKPNVRQDIRDNSVVIRKQRIAEEENVLQSLHRERISAIEALKSSQFAKKVALWISNLVFFLVTGYYIIDSEDIMETLSSENIYIFGIAPLFVLVILTALYYSNCKAKQTELELEWEGKINVQASKMKKMKDELTMIPLMSHIYGMSIDKLLQMQNVLKGRYQAIRGYVGNMKVWYDEEKSNFSQMESLVKDPFLSLLDDETLSRYFESNSETIIKDVYLYKLLKEKDISDEAIISYKKQLKKTVIDRLMFSFEGFSVLKYIMQLENYPFLTNQYSNIEQLLPQMEQKSVVFMQHSTTTTQNPVAQTLFIHCDNQEEKRLWQQNSRSHFRMSPLCSDIISPYSLVLLQMERIKAEDIVL